MHIPRLVRGKSGAWDPNRCLSWADQFLTSLRRNILNWPLPPIRRSQYASASTDDNLAGSKSPVPVGNDGDGQDEAADSLPPSMPVSSDCGTEAAPPSLSDRQFPVTHECLSDVGCDVDEANETRRRERCVWRVTFYPGEGTETVLLDEQQVAEVRNGEDRVGFLPSSYWNQVATPTARKEGSKP